MINYHLPTLRYWPNQTGDFLRAVTLAAATLFSTNVVLAQSNEEDQYFQRFIELYQQSNPSQEDLLAGKEQLELGYQLTPGAIKYTHGLGLASGILNQWDDAVHWLEESLNIAVDPQMRQQIEIEFDYARLQQVIAATQPTAGPNNQESQIYSVNEQSTVDLNTNSTEILPQRVSNRAARASHETPESILRKSLSRRHNLDTLITPPLLLVAVNDDTSVTNHYENGVEAIYEYLSGHYTTQIPQPQLIAMVYPDSDSLHSAARRIYPTLDLGGNDPWVGFYNSADHLLMATVINGNYGPFIHELVHALLNTDSPDLPEWFVEAVARLYQSSQWRNEQLFPVLTKNTKTIQPNSVLTLDSLTEQILSENVNPDSSDIQLFLYFLHQNQKLQLLQTLLNNDAGLGLNMAIAELGIDQSQWRRFLDLTLTPESLGDITDLAENESTVRYIQLALNQVMEKSLDLDGLWGPATEQALRDFQQASELSTDGIPGSRTMQKLANQYSFSSIDTQQQ